MVSAAMVIFGALAVLDPDQHPMAPMARRATSPTRRPAP
jgi:hypothetical protein